MEWNEMELGSRADSCPTHLIFVVNLLREITKIPGMGGGMGVVVSCKDTTIIANHGEENNCGSPVGSSFGNGRVGRSFQNLLNI